MIDINDLIFSFKNIDLKAFSYINDDGDIIEKNYAELFESILEYKSYLSRILSEGDVVVFTFQNNFECVCLFLALTQLNIIPILVSPSLNEAGICRIVKIIKPAGSILFKRDNLKLNELDKKFRTEHINSIIKVLILEESKKIELNHAVILLSSGTSGEPKLIVNTLSNLLRNAYLHSESIMFSKDDRMLLMLPSYFSYGLVSGIITTLINKSHLIFLDRPFHAKNWFNFCNQFNVTICSFTPYLLEKLLKLKIPLPKSLNTITIGGSQTSQKMLDELSFFYKKNVFLTYGLTEAGPRVFTTKYDFNNKGKPVSIGEPLKGVKVKLHNPNLSHDARYVIGELLIKSPTSMLYKIESKSINTDDFVNGWLRTYDLFKKDVFTGEMYYIKRLKKLIEVHGEKVSLDSVRELILTNEYIRDVYVFVYSTSEEEKLISAEIILEKGKNCNDIISKITHWCKKNMKLVEIPKIITIVNEFSFTPKSSKEKVYENF